TMTFNIAGGGGAAFDTLVNDDEVAVRHAQIHPNDEDTRPAGLAFIEVRNQGVLVNEAAVPATSLIENGRFYAQVAPNIATGVAIANPDMARPAEIAFTFTDSAGSDSKAGSLSIPP